MCLKTGGLVAKSVDPDQTPPFATSDQGLHYLFRHVRPNMGCVCVCVCVLGAGGGGGGKGTKR